MGEWYIYGVNGSVKATVKKLEYSGEFMGETSVTCDVYSPSPISFSTGDYLVYRGEMFTIDYDATRLKQARNNTYGKGYTYENMRFLSYVGELKKCDFLDFVLNDNLQHYSQLPVFDFYAETVQDLADRLQANLNRIYTGAKAWTVSVASGFEGKENINVQISKIKCLDALRIAYDQFDAQFVIRGRHIYIGTAGSSIATNFKYGKGNGLKSIERSVDESDGLVTRLRAYGNTTNLPANYYANKGRGCYAPIYEVYGIYTKGADIHFKPKFANNWFTEKSVSSAVHYWVSVSLDKILWMDALVSPNVSNTPDFSVVSVADAYGNNTPEMWAAFKTQLQSATQNTRLYFSKGVNYSNWKSEWKETDAYMPDMMSIDRLMLPGFPDEYTDPYLDSDNISALGVREKSVYFDGSDDELPDIHPSMEGMTAQQLIDAGYTIDLDSGDNGNLDEIAADATEKDGSAITTDGAFVEVNEVPGFKVTLKDIGFDINSYLSGETATLSMKTGMCGGRDFNITKVTKVGNKYVLECQRVEDVNRFFPYNPYTIKAGDKFVLTGIEMPDAYIDAASQRLLTAAQEYLAKHSVPEWVYAIKMDDIWLQRQRDNSVSESASYYWNIKEGDIMSIQDTDLGIDVSEVIDRLSIREGYDPLPTFEVVLRKEKPQGTIGKLQNRIKSLERQNQEQAKTIIRQQDYISLVLGDKIIDIQEQVDNAQVTYFYEGVPTLSNYPASEWDVASYPDHVHDMYYDKTTGKGYEFDISGSTYVWSLIQDEDIVRALADASTAQDTADGKRRVFVTAAGTLPTPPYDAGDMWVNATYPTNNTTTNEAQHKYYNDILKCVTPKAEGGTASINDWTLASKYTDDSSLNAFINGTYAQDLANVKTQTDAKAETWYQSSDPSSAWNTTALKDSHLGDIWLNTTPDANGNTHTYIYRKSGNTYGWEEVNGVPTSVFDMADGKASIYVSKPTKYKANDLWIIESTIAASDIPTGCVKGDIVISSSDSNSYNKAHWTKKDRYTDDTYAHTFDYLSAAMKGDTTVQGGLLLSNTIVLRNLNTSTTPATIGEITAGINGIYDTSLSDPTKSIAAWFGGSMKDKEVYTTASDTAKSLFRFDGSGYVADGNITWDKNGQVTIQGYQIKVGGSNVATQAMLDNFVSKAFFNRLFTAYDANGTPVVPNDTTTAISNLKLMVGTWTEQYLSALGLNSQGGGGTGDVSHIKVSTNPDVYLDPVDGIIDMSDYVSTVAERNIWDTANANINRLMARVPSATFASGNELADKNFVNSSISTATATFRGTVTASDDTDAAAATALATISTKDLNDYAFVKVENTPQTGVDKYKRYKYNGTSWIYEFTLNNSSFTSDQWNAINSGITPSLVTKLNGIAAGAQVNVIESVKVNGTELSISSKAVDITAVPLTIITGADDLKAIEGLSGTGFLKRTGNNTWALDTTVVLNTRTITAGKGLTGGGDLSENRTINVASANAAITVNADNIQLNVINDYITTTNNTIIPLAAARGKDLNDRLAILEAMFTREGAGTAASPYVIKANYGLYTNQFLSSLGQNSQGGSGDFDEEQMWIALGTDVEEKVIDSSHIPDISSLYGYLKASSLNGYATQSWVNSRGFLTSQNIYALTLKADGTTVTTFTPNNAAASLNLVAGTNISLTRGTNAITINNTYSYTLPLAASGTRGGVQIGYSESGKNYAVKLSGEKMYVNVPWENTTYSAGAGISISSGTIINNGVRSITKYSTTAYDILLINTGGTIDYLDLSHQHSYWEILDKPTDLEGFGLEDELNTNYVTIATNQTITGTKTFSAQVTANGLMLSTTKKIYFGDTSHYVELNSTGFHFSHGVYSDSFMSSLGANSSGGGGGDFDEAQMWTALQSTSGTYATTKIATSHIPDMASTYGYLKASSLNGYATQSWVNQQGFLTTHQTLYTLSIYGGTTKVLDFKPNANASIYIKAGGDISLTNDTTNKHITLSYTHPTNGANTTISAASGKVLSAITVNNLGHVTSVSSKTLAAADIPDISATYATASRATTLEGYFNSGGVAKTAAKLNTGTTTYSAWGQTYWSSGVPSSISGNMTGVGSVTPSANGNNLGTSSARFNIYGTGGNFSGALSVTGATTLTGLLTANGNIVTGISNGAYIQIGAIKLVYDSTNNALKVIKSDNTSANLYATGAVSALGSNSSGGGGGDFDEEQMWAALQSNTGTYANEKIDENHIPDMAGIYGYLKQSALSGYVTSVKVGSTAYNPSSGVVSLPAYPTKLSQLANDSGYVTSSGVTSITLKAGAGISLDVDNTAITSTGTRTITNSGVRAATINGNYLRVNTNGTNADLTIPYATSAGSVAWGNVSGKPTTVNGYGITDAVFNISRQSDGILKYYVGSTANYLDFSHNHSYWEILDRPTDLEGFGLEDELNTNYVTIATNQTITGTKTFSAQVTANGLMLSTTKKIYFGDTSHYLELNSTGFHFSHGVYSDSFISALGSNSSGGGGGDFDEAQMWTALQSTSGTYATTKIATNHIPDMASTYGYLKSSALNGYATQAWVNQQGFVTSSGVTSVATGTGLTGGTITSTGTISINSTYQTYISHGESAYNNLVNYLPLTGGIIKNGSTVNPLNIDSTGASTYLYFRNGGVNKTSIGWWNGISYVANEVASGYPRIGVTDAGNPEFWTNSTSNKYAIHTSRDGAKFGGSIEIFSDGNGWNEGVRMHLSSDNWCGVVMCGSDNTGSSGTSAKTWSMHNNDGSFYIAQNGSSSFTNGISCVSGTWAILSSGNVGIGNTSPSQKLHVTGNILASGEVTASSDERLKTIIGDGNLDLRYIANAPNILFKWNNGQDDKVHGGSLAQYFLTGAKHFVLGSDNDYYSLNYGALATSMAISIAKEVVKHDNEITRLKKEVVKLRERVAELEERRVA